jgi:hypothetical protein
MANKQPITPFLPNDVARCAGLTYDAKETQEWYQCKNCLRKLAAASGDWISWTSPPELVNYKCPLYIEYESNKIN